MYEEKVVAINAEAGQDLSAKQFHFGTIAADGQVDPTGLGALADGVIYDNVGAAGRALTLAVDGVVRVKAGAGITRGDLVSSDANGKAKTAASTEQILGKALKTATGDGSIIPVLLKLSGQAAKP